MLRWSGKVAVVTGASAGIGAEVSRKLVEAGLQVVGLARRVAPIEQLAKTLSGKTGKLYAVKTDISKEDEIKNAFEWTSKNVGPVNILINNAGLTQPTTLIDGNTEMWKTVFNTNVLGLCIATREAVKIMRENKIDGHIVHINSVAGHKVPNFPGTHVYPASKHAVTALTETLRQEFNQNGLKIKISSVSPGCVADTEFRSKSVSTVRGPEFEALLEKIPALLKAEDIAEGILYVLSTPPHVQVHELTIKPLGEPF